MLNVLHCKEKINEYTKMKTIFLATAALLSLPFPAKAHRGGYDAHGGHINKDNCAYHCSKKYREKCLKAKANLPEDVKARIEECKNKKKGPVENNRDSLPEYNAASYKFWSDFDGDCRDTRAEILIDSSLEPVTFTKDSKCKVKTGRWICPYSGREYTYARDIHIDHVVSREEAHVSGAVYWTMEEKEKFANDKDNLLPVAGSANMEKGHKDPSRWIPEVEENICPYIARWIWIKEKYRLTMDEEEAKAVSEIQEACR